MEKINNNEKFDQKKYLAEWSKKNMMFVRGQYKREFVLQFKEACRKLGVTQSEVIRQAMEETIRKAEEK